MRVDKIAAGINPPEDINVIIEVPVGGQPVKYEMDKDSGSIWDFRMVGSSDPSREKTAFGAATDCDERGRAICGQNHRDAPVRHLIISLR